MTDTGLSIKQLCAYYGKSQAVDTVDLDVNPGEIVALVGRNGAGKSTTLKSVMGMVSATGTVSFEGVELKRSNPYEVARRGIAFVPENRGIFAALTVEQNLEIAVQPGAKWSVGDVFERFPRLAERRRNSGDKLSGGEQQMLAIARGLVGNPKLILLDEPSEGLAPVIVEQVRDLIKETRAAGIAVLLVEQQIELCLQLAQRVYVMESGRIVWSGDVDEFARAKDVQNTYLALTAAG